MKKGTRERYRVSLAPLEIDIIYRVSPVLPVPPPHPPTSPAA